MKYGEMEQTDVNNSNYNLIINIENYGECYF